MEFFAIHIIDQELSTCEPLASLQAKTEKQVKNIIKYQLEAGFKRIDYAICKRSGSDQFQCIDTGKFYKFVKASFKQKYFDEFVKNY